MLALLVSTSLSASIFVLITGLVGLRRTARFNARMDSLGGQPMSVEDFELSQPFAQRFLIPVLRSVGAIAARRMPMERINQMRSKLALAGNPGNPGNLSVPEFMAIRVVGAFLLGGIAPMLLLMVGSAPLHAIVLSVVGGGIAYFYPMQFVKRKAGARQKSIQKALPDTLDLLTITVEAGLGFELALKRVTEKWNNALSFELQQVLTDMRIGRPRREALKDMVERTGVEDLSTFVSSIIQAEQLGVGVVQVLRIQSEQLRLLRRQRAQEKAQKAPIKILIPMVIFIFPSLYVVLLGPALPRILESFSGG